MTSVDGTGATRPGSASATGPVALMGELLPDGLVVVGGDRRIRFVNAEALRILDCDESDVVGRACREGLPLTDKYGRDWWAHTDPWNGLASRPGHREKLLVAPKGHDVLVTARYVRADGDGSRRAGHPRCCATPRPGSAPSATRRRCSRRWRTSCGPR